MSLPTSPATPPRRVHSTSSTPNRTPVDSPILATPTPPAMSRSSSAYSDLSGGSTRSNFSTGSALARLELEKGNSKFGVGFFQRQASGDQLTFVAKKYPSTSEFGPTEWPLVLAAQSAAAGTDQVIINLPDKLYDNLETGVIRYFFDDSSDPFAKEVAINIRESIRSYRDRMRILLQINSDFDGGKLSDPTADGIDVKEILFTQILFESETLLGLINKTLRDSKVKITSQITSLTAQIAKEKKSARLSAEERADQERKADAARLKQQAKAPGIPLPPTITRIKKSLAEQEGELLRYESLLEKYSNIVPPPPGTLPKPDGAELPLANDHRFFSYTINSRSGNPEITLTVDNDSKRRPDVMGVDGKLTDAQGDHVSAYLMLLHLFMRSIPFIGRYDGLPIKVKEMLSLVFPDAVKESFLTKADFETSETAISDAKRRSFLEKLEASSYPLSKEINHLIKSFQVAQSCRQICRVGDSFLATANAEANASIPIIKPGSTGPAPLISRSKTGGTKGEGDKMDRLEEIVQYFAAKDLLKLIDGDLERVAKSTADYSAKEARTENLTTLKENLLLAFRENKYYLEQASKSDVDFRASCEEVGELLAAFIDLPSIPKAASDDPAGEAMDIFKDFLRNALLRHFRLSGVMLASTLNGLNNDKPKSDGTDIFGAVIDGFFATVISTLSSPSQRDLKDLIISIGKKMVNKESGSTLDAVTPGEPSEKVEFTTFLRTILEERTRKFQENYLTLRAGENATSSPPKPNAFSHFPRSPLPLSRGTSLESQPDEGIDIFNLVSDNSNLTHQNLLWLLRKVFIDQGISEVGYDRAENISVAVISENPALDVSLLDTILYAIGSDPYPDRVSIALCRGHLDPRGNITGNTHWTGLHLRIVEDPSSPDRKIIQAYHTDSMGVTEIPNAVTRVLDHINAGDNFGSLKNGPLKDTVRARLQQLTAQPCLNKTCARQRDGHSCGDRTVFNLAKMHEDPALDLTSDVEVGDFISRYRPILQTQFNPGADLSGFASKYGESSADAGRIFGIICDKETDFQLKLFSLIEIAQLMRDQGRQAALSLLKMEALYQKIISDWITSIKLGIRGITESEDLDLDSLESYLNKFSSLQACQNPEDLIPTLQKISNDPDDFVTSLKAGRLEELYPLPDSLTSDSAPLSEPLTVPISTLKKLPAGPEKSTFLLLGPGINRKFPRLEEAAKYDSCTIHSCDSEAKYEVAIREIAVSDREKGLHVIIYGHGAQRQVYLGRHIFPESILEELGDRTAALTAISVASCGAGFESQKVTLDDAQVVVIHAGKRSTMSSADTERVLTIAGSGSFVPRLISSSSSESFTLTPPETIKVITKDGVAKLSPFDAFKKDGRPSREKVLEKIIEQQRGLDELFSKTDSEAKGAYDKRTLLSGTDLTSAASSPAMTRYLQELAFLVVVTKEDKTVGYLRHLVEELGVDPNQPYESHGEKLSLIIEACASGNIEMADYLITRDPSQLTKTTESGTTPLLEACNRGQNEMVMHLLSKMEGLTEASATLEASADMNQVFIAACKGGCSPEVVSKILGKGGVDLRQTDDKDNNCLHHAATAGNLELFRFLYERSGSGEELSAAENKALRTPADVAIQLRNIEIIRFAQEKKLPLDPDRLKEIDLDSPQFTVESATAKAAAASSQERGFSRG